MKTEELLLKPKRKKLILLTVVSLLFVLSGISMIEDDAFKGWFVMVFFGICVLVFVIQLIPGAMQLKLTKDGFIMTNLFKSHFTRWEDIESFKLDYLGTRKVVAFDYVSSHTKYSIGKSMAKKVSNSHGAFPDTYGLKVKELLDLVNEWKQKSNTVHNSGLPPTNH